MTTVLKPHVRDLGGFSVRRLLPAFAHKMVGPFIFFDHMGPASLAPGQGMDVRPHPHIGLATVTYLFEGAILHRDSLGCVQRIEPGDVNWMTAGRGIVHSERSAPEDRAAGIRMHGIQTWIALPLADEDAEPAFAHHPKAALPVIDLPGAQLRLILGTYAGRGSPVKVFSPMFYVAAELQAGATLAISTEHEERAVYVVEGDVTLDDAPLPAGHMGVLAPRAPARLRAIGPARVMLAGGAKMDGDRFIWWNFVASSRERIEAAKQRWREQAMGAVPGETEWIPLPEK